MVRRETEPLPQGGGGGGSDPNRFGLLKRRATPPSTTQKQRNNNHNSATQRQSSSDSATPRMARGGRSRRTVNNNNQTQEEGVRTFRVRIPEGVRPGEEFHADVGDRMVRVRCPHNGTPNQILNIKISREGSEQIQTQQQQQPEPDSPNVIKLRNPGNGAPDAYLVEIPPGVRRGKKFQVTIAGQLLQVTCPKKATPGMQVRVVPPASPAPPLEDRAPADDATVDHSVQMASTGTTNRSLLSATENSWNGDTQLFEVVLPWTAIPGQPFALKAGGMRVQVNCPMHAMPGERIRFRLPVAMFATPQDTSATALQRLEYDKEGWSRTVRVYDQAFQWVRMDQKGEIDMSYLGATRFDPEKSAFCRRLDFVEGLDFRVRDGLLDLVPAHAVTCGTKVRRENGEPVVTYADMAEVQGRSFEEKERWFRRKCKELEVDWESGHMRINVRRNFLLEDSLDAVMSLSRRDLRKIWRFEFIGEKGVDAGGLAREWFHLVTSSMFDAGFGFWTSLEANQMCMTINPASSKYSTARLQLY